MVADGERDRCSAAALVVLEPGGEGLPEPGRRLAVRLRHDLGVLVVQQASQLAVVIVVRQTVAMVHALGCQREECKEADSGRRGEAITSFPARGRASEVPEGRLLGARIKGPADQVDEGRNNLVPRDFAALGDAAQGVALEVEEDHPRFRDLRIERECNVVVPLEVVLPCRAHCSTCPTSSLLLVISS